MANPSKQRGTAFETACVEYLRAHGFPEAERRTQHGNKDRGDVSGVCSVAIELKACREITLASFIDEAIVEQANAGASSHLVVAKRRMKGIDRAYAVQEFGQWVAHARTYLDLLHEVELHRRSA